MAKTSENISIEPSQISQNDFLDNLKNKIVEDGSKMEWVNSIIQRNAISIKALIEADVFGTLSDFNDDYPGANTHVRIQILKALLENKEYCKVDGIEYNVKNITAPLNSWLEHHENFDKTLDTAIVREKFAKRVSWLVQLNANTKPIYDALYTLSVLNYMEEALKESNLQPQKLEELRKWISDSKKTLFKNSSLIQKEAVAPYSLFTGAYSFKRLFQYEVEKIKILTQSFRENINRINQINSFSGILSSVFSSLNFGLSSTVRLGMLALLPSRILITAIREGASLCSTLLYRGMSSISPNYRPSLLSLKLISFGFHLAILMSLISYSQAPIMLMLGFQAFPQNWTFGFISQMTLGIAATQLAAGIGFRSYNNVKSWLDPIAHTQNTLQTEPESTSTQAPAISPAQRQTLIRLLMLEKSNINSNTELTQDDKKTKAIQLNNEIRDLTDQSKPYILTQYDKDLIKAKDTNGFDLGGNIDLGQEDSNTNHNLRSTAI